MGGKEPGRFMAVRAERGLVQMVAGGSGLFPRGTREPREASEWRNDYNL